MARRVDFFDDPAAPPVNSVVPSANVVVVDELGALLLIRRTDNDNWALPGGAMDPGESMTDCAVRETFEETGMHVEVTGLVGIYWVEPSLVDGLQMHRSMRLRISHYLAGIG